jgi:hypothetical protein
MTFRPLSVEDIIAARERDGAVVRRVGRYFVTNCPAHDDRRPSLAFGEGEDGSAWIIDYGGCTVIDVVRCLKANGTAIPLSPAERESRCATDEADRDARIARARARHERALTHPDRRRALQHFAPALRWDVADLLDRGVGWDGGRVVFPIVDYAGAVVCVDCYAPPNSAARRAGEAKLLANGIRGPWPAPATVAELRYIVEGAPAAATMLGCGLPAIGFPSAAAGVRLVDATLLRAAGANDLVVLADGDAVGRSAARTSVLVLRDVGVRARAIDLFPELDDGRDVADELRARDDGVDWLTREVDDLQPKGATR